MVSVRQRRRFAARVAVLLAAAVLPLVATAAVGAQSELDTARANARAAAAAADEAREAAAAARDRADAAVAELELAIGALESLEARIRVVEINADDAAVERDSLRGAVLDLAVRRYVANDRQSPEEISAAGPQEQARASTLFRFALLGGGDELDRFRVVDQEYDIALTELAEMEAQLAVAEEKEAEFRREVARLEAEERRRLEQERQRRLAEQRRRAAEEAQRRAAEESRRTQAPVLRGPNGFLCPIGGATSFSDTWGAPRSGGRSHKGVDMFAARGTPVVASVSGSVRFRDSSLGGKSFYLDGDDGNRYYGAHLDSYGTSGRVTAGTVVGTVGNTGNARFSSPHLHFEIHLGGGGAVNPTPTVRAAC